MNQSFLAEETRRRNRKCHTIAIGSPVAAAAIWNGAVLAVWLCGHNLLDMTAGVVVGIVTGILGVAGSVAAVIIYYPKEGRRLLLTVAYIVLSPVIYLSSCIAMLVLTALLTSFLYGYE